MMGQVLAEYPSASKPGKSYEIILGNDGKTYCTCWQWKLNRTCKHLEDWLTSPHAAGYKKSYRTDPGQSKPSLYLELEKAIEKAINELS
jgi:hypothetical protein